MREKVSDEICNCGHRKSQHQAIVCGWWNCNCKHFEPLTADEPKRELKPVEEFPHAGDITSAAVAAQEISADVATQEISADVATQEVSVDFAAQEVSADFAAQGVSADVATQEVEELRSKLRAAQEEIGRLKQLQDGNDMLATRLGAENNLLKEALAEIKRLVEAILAQP
jgi:hypothetical protein